MFNFNLLPSPADNQYRGNKASFWFFIAFVCLMTWRSIIHMFFEEYGAHSIANIIVLTGVVIVPPSPPALTRNPICWRGSQIDYSPVLVETLIISDFLRGHQRTGHMGGRPSRTPGDPE